MDSLFSFPVGLFHPLQHAGLSRRTRVARDPTEAVLLHLRKANGPAVPVGLPK
jgi:hypothetical protein